MIKVILSILLLVTASIVQAAAPSRPNILFCIADDWGLQAGAYGTKWVHTPNFDRVAAQGVLFLNAYTPNAKCSPSRASILTGRNPWQNGVAGDHFVHYPAELKSWMEALADTGYSIGFTGKGWGPGRLPPKRAQLTGKAWSQIKCPTPTKDIHAIDYFENFKAFLAAAPNNQPFCFWYGGMEPHRPYEENSGLTKAGLKPAAIHHVPAYWPDNETTRGDLLDYSLEVSYFDRQLGKMLDHLQAEGLLENTIVVVTSDNGPPFPRMKGHPYEASCHLPLAVLWPQGIVQPGRKTEALISFIDFAPTLLELAGISEAQSGMRPITGKSFRDILQNQTPATERPRLLLGRERNDPWARPGGEFGFGYPVRALLNPDGLLYLHNFEPDRWPSGDPEMGLKDTDDGPTKNILQGTDPASQFWQFNFGKRPAEELYRVTVDPDCINNLASDPAHKDTVEKLRAELFSKLREENDPRLEGKGDLFDHYPTSMNPKKGKAARSE